jgi:hypothetical protein
MMLAASTVPVTNRLSLCLRVTAIKQKMFPHLNAINVFAV